MKHRKKIFILLLAFVMSFSLMSENIVFAKSHHKDFKVRNLRTTRGENRQLTLTWDIVPEASGYYIFRMYDGDRYMPYIGYTLEAGFTEIPEKAGFVYYVIIPFKVDERGKQIQGTYDRNTYGYTEPPAVQGLTAKAEDVGIRLQWEPSPGATEYSIKRRLSGSELEVEIDRTKAISYLDDCRFTLKEVTYVYNVYPVYRGRGIELQGRNTNYAYATYVPKECEWPKLPDLPDLPELPDIKDWPTLKDLWDKYKEEKNKETTKPTETTKPAPTEPTEPAKPAEPTKPAPTKPTTTDETSDSGSGIWDPEFIKWLIDYFKTTEVKP